MDSALLVDRIEMVDWPFCLLQRLVIKFIGLELLPLVNNESFKAMNFYVFNYMTEL